MFNIEPWKIALDKAMKEILEHPFGVICKHWMIAKICSNMEEAGFPQSDEFVKAVVYSKDEEALECFPVFAK